MLRVAEDLSNWLSPAFGGAVIKADFDGVEALAEDRAALWARVGSAEFLSDAEKRAMLGIGGVAVGRSASTSLRALIAKVQFATVEMKFDLFVRAFERRYRADQLRAPAGMPEGGQWIADLLNPPAGRPDQVHVAAMLGPRCDGFSAGCQFGGTFGTTGMYRIAGKNLCRDCAVKFLGIQGLPFEEQLETLHLYDKTNP